MAVTVDEKNLRCGLLGRKLGHTFSPLIHKMSGEYSYDIFEREPEDVNDFLKNGDYDAINVTIPYKIDAYNACDVLSDEAKAIGSVNTVVKKDGKLFGYNTDFFGFKYMLESAGVTAKNKKCLVLGSGGASKTVVAALKAAAADAVYVISRSGENNYDNVYELHSDAEIIINTTPVGMYPDADAAPVDVSKFSKCIFAGDVVYNPAKTKFLYEAEQCGIKTANGLSMLVAQGVMASGFFTGKGMNEKIVPEICRAVRMQTVSVVLTGMPGSGKSSIGKLIAKSLGRQFVDIDEEIVKYTGKTIPEIFADGGEEAFRRIETEVTKDICKKSGLVIATGGGVVTRPENKFALKCNGVVVYIKRAVEDLPSNGRPLSVSKGPEAIYRERKALYESWADITCENNSSLEKCARSVISSYQKFLISAKSFYIYTLGCKVNRYESVALSDLLCDSGRYVALGDGEKNSADVTLINSCMVTGESEKKASKLIRRIRRENPETVLLLCGCIPQAAPERAETMGADIIAGNKNRRKILSLLDEYFSERQSKKIPVNAVEKHAEGDKFEILAPREYKKLTRANLKIQDGCDRFCAYCIIPYARGPLRSMPVDEVFSQAKRLVENGHKEIVLNGINLGLYGVDIGSSLAEAVETVSKAGAERIRLGSLEVDLLTDKLLLKLSSVKGFCPHFHASLQSGSDTVLKRMNRRYDKLQYKTIIDNIKKYFPNAAITTDIIVGFEGETDAEFSESIDFCKEIGFCKIHVFPYSVREGTEAAKSTNQIPESIKKLRAAKMAEVGEALSLDFRRNQIGKCFGVLFETYRDGFWYGHTENFLYVRVQTEKNLKNTLCSVKIVNTVDAPESELLEGVLAN